MVNLENKFYKVSHNSGSFVTGDFFNPVTKEHRTEVLRDYDYSDCSRDNDKLYYMEVDEDVKRIWLHYNGKILKGDTVEVVKGRKLPIGYVGIVKEIKPFYDRYHRLQAYYIYFADGQKTNINNCMLIAAAF